MKLIQHIRPTTHRTEADQRRAGAQFEPAFVVVVGHQGRTFETTLKQLKRNSDNGVLIENPGTLSRRRDVACAMLEQIFAKGASVVFSDDGSVHSPECGASLIAGVRSRGVTMRGDEPKPRVAHNRASDEVRAEAKRYWTQKQFARMTNGEIAEAVGVSVVTLTDWFGPRGRKPGRPKQG